MDNEERYISSTQLQASGSVHTFYLQRDKNQKDFDTESFGSYELESSASTPSSQRKVDIVTSEKVDVKVRAKSIKSPEVSVFFSNPGAEDGEKEEKLETLDTNFGEMVGLSNLNTNNNNNNNNVGGTFCTYFYISISI